MCFKVRCFVGGGGKCDVSRTVDVRFIFVLLL